MIRPAGPRKSVDAAPAAATDAANKIERSSLGSAGSSGSSVAKVQPLQPQVLLALQPSVTFGDSDPPPAAKPRSGSGAGPAVTQPLPQPEPQPRSKKAAAVGSPGAGASSNPQAARKASRAGSPGASLGMLAKRQSLAKAHNGGAAALLPSLQHSQSRDMTALGRDGSVAGLATELSFASGSVVMSPSREEAEEDAALATIRAKLLNERLGLWKRDMAALLLELRKLSRAVKGQSIYNCTEELFGDWSSSIESLCGRAEDLMGGFHLAAKDLLETTSHVDVLVNKELGKATRQFHLSDVVKQRAPATATRFAARQDSSPGLASGAVPAGQAGEGGHLPSPLLVPHAPWAAGVSGPLSGFFRSGTSRTVLSSAAALQADPSLTVSNTQRLLTLAHGLHVALDAIMRVTRSEKAVVYLMWRDDPCDLRAVAATGHGPDTKLIDLRLREPHAAPVLALQTGMLISCRRGHQPVTDNPKLTLEALHAAAGGASPLFGPNGGHGLRHGGGPAVSTAHAYNAISLQAAATPPLRGHQHYTARGAASTPGGPSGSAAASGSSGNVAPANGATADSAGKVRQWSSLAIPIRLHDAHRPIGVLYVVNKANGKCNYESDDEHLCFSAAGVLASLLGRCDDPEALAAVYDPALPLPPVANPDAAGATAPFVPSGCRDQLVYHTWDLSNGRDVKIVSGDGKSAVKLDDTVPVLTVADYITKLQGMWKEAVQLNLHLQGEHDERARLLKKLLDRARIAELRNTVLSQRNFALTAEPAVPGALLAAGTGDRVSASHASGGLLFGSHSSAAASGGPHASDARVAGVYRAPPAASAEAYAALHPLPERALTELMKEPIETEEEEGGGASRFRTTSLTTSGGDSSNCNAADSAATHRGISPLRVATGVSPVATPRLLSVDFLPAAVSQLAVGGRLADDPAKPAAADCASVALSRVVSADRLSMSSPLGDGGPPSGHGSSGRRFPAASADAETQTGADGSAAPDDTNPSMNLSLFDVRGSNGIDPLITLATGNLDARNASAAGIPTADSSIHTTMSTRSRPKNLSTMDRVERSKVLSAQKPKYRLGRVIGSGTHGIVYQALIEDTGETVAAKRIVLRVADSDIEQKIKSLQREINLLKALEHENIVRYLFTERGLDGADNSGEATRSILIFMEYVSGGSFVDILKSYGAVPEVTAVMFAAQLLIGLEFLHSRHVVHRDIKPANCLVTSLGIVKVGDFGTARLLEDRDGETEGVSLSGTPYYMAPEVIRQESCDWPVDIWALGCTVMELVTGLSPWAHLNETVYNVLSGIATSKTAFPMPSSVSNELADFLRLCLTPDPASRPSATELLLHPWIAKFDVLEKSDVHHTLDDLGVGGFVVRPKVVNEVGTIVVTSISAMPEEATKRSRAGLPPALQSEGAAGKAAAEDAPHNLRLSAELSATARPQPLDEATPVLFDHPSPPPPPSVRIARAEVRDALVQARRLSAAQKRQRIREKEKTKQAAAGLVPPAVPLTAHEEAARVAGLIQKSSAPSGSSESYMDHSGYLPDYTAFAGSPPVSPVETQGKESKEPAAV